MWQGTAAALAVSASLGIAWTIVAERAIPVLLVLAGILYLRRRRPRG